MRVTKLFGKTSKTEGKNNVTPSHRLLIQAGFIRESVAGRYFLLPLGMRVFNKITDVIRQNMDAAGSQEMVAPVLHPLQLWEETNRTSSAGFELMGIKDRRGEDFVLGGTAEEMMCDVVRKFGLSYRDLPFSIYQFSKKFRDELRAKGGLLRVREFVMKDAYSFGTIEQFEPVYVQMRDTYSSIFDQLGLKTDVVDADNGYIGGEYCHEFVAESPSGESRYFVDSKGYCAHEDVAVVKLSHMNPDQEMLPMREVEAIRGKTMEEGMKVHDLSMSHQIKDVMYVDETNDQYVLAVIRGDFDVNSCKLDKLVKSFNMRPATEDEIINDLGTMPGFISPVGIARVGKNTGRKLIIVADPTLRTVINMYGGANKKHRDLFNVNIDRDYQPDIEADILLAKDGENSINDVALVEKKGIEVGNIFQLGYHYTDLMGGPNFADDTGKQQPLYMGCYGIGLERTMAAVVEVHNDDRGIIWPERVAPYRLSLVALGKDKEVIDAADRLYDDLVNAGVEVLYDDRMQSSAGEKLADSDLIGIPHRIVLSAKTLAAGKYEYKNRSVQSAVMVNKEELNTILGIV
jgi:prolyl-tRNA synthetase